MPDGVRLAAKLWLPDNAGPGRVPTIIEVLPYRKRDIYAPRDAMHHRYFAGHGYACMRVDIRGSGDSDGNQGVFAMRQEQDDTLEVLKWIAAQPWSDGQVAMFGISWGGFQAIQTAYRAPKELKALGKHPDSGADVKILDGRYGPYVTDGETNASVPKGTQVEAVTMATAIELLNARAGMGGRKGRKAKTAKASAKKKAAPKKKTA